MAALLLLAGGALLKISLTGTYLRYVKPGLLPLLLVGGAVLVTVGGVSLWQVIRDRAGGRLDDHDSAHHAPKASWLLLIPILTLLALAPPALGSYQAGRNGTAIPARASSDFPPLPDGDPVRISVLEYASRAVHDDGRTLAGRRMVLSGFVIAGEGGQPYLARMIVSCCAADARPIKVGLTGSLPGDLAPDEWIEVTGSYVAKADRDPVNGEPIPYVAVDSVRSIPEPESGYES